VAKRGHGVAQTDRELLSHLEEQVRFLLRSADAYDAGDEAEAKRLATAIRVLVHDTAASHSLLTQIGIRSLPFLDTAGPLYPRNLASETRLTIMRIGPEGASWVPKNAMDYESAPIGLPFERWWNAPVIKGQSGETYSRKDIVLSLADQDGGAHVDPAMNESYHRLSRGNALGWEAFAAGAEVGRPMEGPELASVRQIAHELLLTIERRVPVAIPEDRRHPRSERRRLV